MMLMTATLTARTTSTAKAAHSVGQVGTGPNVEMMRSGSEKEVIG